MSVKAAQKITIHEWIRRIRRSFELKAPRREIAKVRKMKTALMRAPRREGASG